MVHEKQGPILESPLGGLRRERREEKEEQKRIDCEAKGGKWDVTNQVCILPEATDPSPIPTP